MPDRSEFREYSLTNVAQGSSIFSGTWGVFSQASFVERNGEVALLLSGAGHLNASGAAVLDPASLQVSRVQFGPSPIIHERAKGIQLVLASPSELRCTTPTGASTIRVEGAITAFAAMQP